MAAAMTVQQQTQGLGTLQALIDLANNPKQIATAHENARKELALTEEQARQSAEAKDFIAKHGQLQKDLKAREDKLAADKNGHEQTVYVFKNLCEEKDEFFKAKATELKAQADSQTDIENTQAKERKQLDTDKKAHAEEYKLALKKLEEKALADDKIRVANEVRAEKLAAWEIRLNTKAAKFQEASAI